MAENLKKFFSAMHNSAFSDCVVYRRTFRYVLQTILYRNNSPISQREKINNKGVIWK